MLYRMRMVHDADQEARRVYVDSLRWRRSDLQGKIEAIGRQMAAWARDETELKQQMRAVEQLLTAEGEQSVGRHRVMAPPQEGVATSASGPAPDSDHASLGLARWGPKSGVIYAAAAEVIREAGVPLHYRVLAGEVQKRVALGGVDPGATLIAHLHRAKDVFPRVGRGIYGLQGMVANARPDVPADVSPTRRCRTRRRTR